MKLMKTHLNWLYLYVCKVLHIASPSCLVSSGQLYAYDARKARRKAAHSKRMQLLLGYNADVMRRNK